MDSRGEARTAGRSSCSSAGRVRLLTRRGADRTDGSQAALALGDLV